MGMTRSRNKKNYLFITYGFFLFCKSTDLNSTLLNVILCSGKSPKWAFWLGKSKDALLTCKCFRDYGQVERNCSVSKQFLWGTLQKVAGGGANICLYLHSTYHSLLYIYLNVYLMHIFSMILYAPWYLCTSTPWYMYLFIKSVLGILFGN